MSRTIARRDEVWCMSGNDCTFLLEETQLREDNYEYNTVEANTIMQIQREEKTWMNTDQAETTTVHKLEEEGL